VRLSAPGSTYYVLTHPEHIEQVLRSRHQDFIKWKLLRDTARVFGEGLLTSEGDVWKRQRKLTNPAFMLSAVRGHADCMVSYTTRLMQDWRPGQTRVISDEMVRLTLAIIARTLFDVDVEQEARPLRRILESVLDYYGDPLNSLLLPPWFPSPANLRLRRSMRALDELIAGLIEQRRHRAGEGSELLSRLLSARDEDGSQMSDRQLRDELVTLGFAGHKTTAAALTYCFYLLAQSPEVEAQLLDELAAVLGDRPPTAEDYSRLSFTQCVVKEALRLYPPSWGIGREAVRDVEVGGYHVPKGTQLLLVQWVVHRDGRWFAEPGCFRPQRWQGDLEERLPRCAYFPFGDGPRICIGGHFAMLEIVLILAAIARRFRLTLVPGQKFKLVPSITLWPKPGIRMVLGER
jgi:cytochrome P450